MDAGGSCGRALLVGPLGENLRGVDHDLQRMTEMLRSRQFVVEVCSGDRATRAGILEAYDQLIRSARPDEPAVFYYAGHGFYGFEAPESRSWRGICPADLDKSDTTDF